MTRTKIIMMAMTSRIWMNPPIVYDDTKPKSQAIIRISARVYNMVVHLIGLGGF